MRGRASTSGTVMAIIKVKCVVAGGLLEAQSGKNANGPLESIDFPTMPLDSLGSEKHFRKVWHPQLLAEICGWFINRCRRHSCIRCVRDDPEQTSHVPGWHNVVGQGLLSNWIIGSCARQLTSKPSFVIRCPSRSLYTSALVSGYILR